MKTKVKPQKAALYQANLYAFFQFFDNTVMHISTELFLLQMNLMY